MKKKKTIASVRDQILKLKHSEQTCVRLVNLWKKHIVALNVIYEESKKIENVVFTGFLLDLFGAKFWITAGHVVRNIESALKAPNIKIRTAQWADGFPDKDADFIPVDLNSLRMGSIDDNGIDLGMIAFDSNSARLLEVNPEIEFVTPRIWNHNELAKPDAYYLIGLPSMHVRTEIERKPGLVTINTKFPIVVLPLRRIESRPDGVSKEFWTPSDAFFGELVPVNVPTLGEITDIKGMSGGPILSLEVSDDEMRYRVFAIQSAWLESRRLIRGTPIRALDQELRAAIEKLEAA